jgi:glyoxylase-like metal-dependent hydrolase (beta-lactamase superfamily II)
MAAPELPSGMHVFERGWLSANNILFTDGAETALVDSGYCSHAAQTLSLVDSVLVERPLNVLVNTHLHSDHCGGNAALQRRYPELRTAIPPGQAQLVANWDPVALTYFPTGQRCPQFKFDQTIQPGSQVRFGVIDWQVHAAAGHDPHSLVFFEPTGKILISADALWENGFGVVFPELEGADAFAQVAATLDMIEHLAPKTIIPGHGSVFSYSPEVLKRARQRLDSFVKNPARHARHAAKVLLKFKLLETQRQSFDEFANWAIATPYLMQIRAKFFADAPRRSWIEQLFAELIAAGVATKEGAYILNA